MHLLPFFVLWEWEIHMLILPPKYAVRKEEFFREQQIALCYQEKFLFPFASSFVNCTRKKNHFVCVCHLIITTHPI